MNDLWDKYTLGDVAEFINGRAFKPSEWEDNGKPIIRIQDLTGSIKDPHYTTKTYESKYLVKRGDLLISWSATLDAFIWNREEAWLNQHIFKVKEDPGLIDLEFLYYLVRHQIDFLKRQTHGSTMKHITKKDFVRMKIRLPSTQKQKKIVSILEKAEQLKQWRNESDKLTDDYLNSVFLEMFGDPLVNPKKWEIKNIKEIASREPHSIKAGPFGSSLKKEFYVEKGYKIYGQEQVIRDDLSFGDYYINEEKYNELQNCTVQEGDILISLVGTFGRISIVPKNFEAGIINPRLMKITLDKDLMDPVFFKFLLISDGVRAQIEHVARGGTMDIVNVGIMKEIKIPVPPKNLQIKFVNIVNQVQYMKKHQLQSQQQINDLFNVLMQKAFRGELIC